MNEKGKISVFQFFSVLFVSRVVSFFTFVLPSGKSYSSGDHAIVGIVMIGILLISCIPILLTVNEKSENSGILLKADSRLKKPLALIYTAYFVWVAAMGLSRYELYVSTVMFPGENMKPFIALILVCSVIVAYKGIETLGRASVVTGVITAVSIIFIALTVADKFSYLNLAPVLEKGILPPAENAFFSAARTAEPISMLIAAPLVKGNTKKGFVVWTVSFCISMAVIFTIIGGVTGMFGERQIFQLYTLTMLAKLGVFERMDDLITGVWVLCMLFRTAYFIFICHESVDLGFEIKTKKNKSVFAVITIAVFCVYYFTSGSVSAFAAASDALVNEILFILTATLLPLIVFIIYKIRKRKKQHEA